MKRTLLAAILIAISTVTFAQVFNGTSAIAVYSAPSGGPFGPVSFSGVPPQPTGPGTLKFFYRGDLDFPSASEWYQVNDETNTLIGQSLSAPQCGANYDSTSFTIPVADLAAWAADGIITFNFVAGSGVNGSSLCSQPSGAYVKLEYPFQSAPVDGRAKDLTSINYVDGYASMPASQVQGMFFSATAENIGDSLLTGVTLDLSIPGTPFTANYLIDTLMSKDDSTVTFLSGFTATSVDTFTAQAVISSNQADTVYNNDTAYYDIILNDTSFIRDDGVAANGIGNATSVAFGHKFSMYFADTISSVSFYLDNPTQGTKIRCLLYSFNPVTQEPDILIDSTRVIQIGPNGAGWYTERMGCGEVFLPSGEYFIAAEQINPVNMSFGYSNFYPSGVGVINFVDLKDGQGWLPSTSPSLNQLLNTITFMLRVNIGHPRNINVLGGDTTFYCNGTTAKLKTGLNYDIYNWSNGSFLDSLVTSTDGFYAVTVTDDANCVFNGSTWVKELNPISTFPTTTPTSTCGGNDGSATMVAVGDKPPFVFSWSNGQSGFTATGLPGGKHFVTITDAIGCDYIESVDVLGAYPVVNISTTSPICNGFFNGSATANAVQGVSPINYNWSNGGSGSTINGISAGNYTVSVTDASGCTTVQTASVTNPPIINVDFSNSTNPTLCRANNGVAVANVSGGLAPYSFAWDNGQNTNSIISLKAGTYNVTITDSVGCQKTGSVTLTDPNPPSLSTTGSTVVCGDDSTGTASVNVTGGTPPYNVLWSTNSTSNSISNLPSGSYGVQVIDGAGCVSFDNAIVSGPDPILAILQANYDLNNICNNDIFISQLSGGTPPYSYQWDDPNSQTTASATGLCNGAYNVVITDANSCTKDFSIIIFNPKTGVGEVAENSSLEIYPNPSNGLINFNLKKHLTNAQIEIFAINGELVKSINPNNQLMMNIDLSNLAEGSYVVKLTSDEEHVVQQIQIIK